MLTGLTRVTVEDTMSDRFLEMDFKVPLDDGRVYQIATIRPPFRRKEEGETDQPFAALLGPNFVNINSVSEANAKPSSAFGLLRTCHPSWHMSSSGP